MRTSYFARSGKSPNAVSIASSAPRYYKGHRYLPLAPTWDMIKLTDEAEYTAAYVAYLQTLDPQKVVDDLRAITDDPILLCYEKEGEFCHRNIVAEWLGVTLSMDISELE